MTGALLIATLTSGLYYLASRAGITRWLWSRYPRPLAALLNCSACSGFWYGLGLGWLLHARAATFHVAPSIFGISTDDPLAVFMIVCAFVGLIWTPVFAFVHAYAYSQLSEDPDQGVPSGT